MSFRLGGCPVDHFPSYLSDLFVFDLQSKRSPLPDFNSAPVTDWEVGDNYLPSASSQLATISCSRFAVVYAQIFSHHRHTTKSAGAKVMPMIMQRSLRTTHTSSLKSQILTGLVWGRSIIFRDSYEIVQSELVFFKVGNKKQYYEEITLIFTFFLVCWSH